MRTSSSTDARQIARKLNVKHSGSGHVTEFFVHREYGSRFRVKIVGSLIHQELWVPAEQLEDFNNNLIGKIELIETYNAAGDQVL